MALERAEERPKVPSLREVKPVVVDKKALSASKLLADPSELRTKSEGGSKILTKDEAKKLMDQAMIRSAMKGGNDEDMELHRGNWNNRMEFILASLGNVVGIGNVWRFPFLAYKNGGAVFVFAYIVVLFLVGFPMLVLETYLGQYTQMGAANAFKHLSPLFVGMGYCTILTSWIIGTYYNMILAWSVYYLGDVYPARWANCSYFPKDRCASVGEIRHYVNYSLPSELYFKYWAMNQSPTINEWGMPGVGLSFALAVTTSIVIGSTLHGTSSTGKVVYVTATFPYFFMTILFIRGITLDGAANGIKYYLMPRSFLQLFDPIVWKEALIQSFYSVGVGIGVMITFGSYNKFHNPLVKDVLIIIMGDFLTCLAAGFIVFSMIGNVALLMGKDVSDTVDAGPGLAFVVIIAGLSQMPWSTFWVLMFLIMLFFLGVDSVFSYIEHSTTYISDRLLDAHKKPNKPLITIIIGVIFFVPGLIYCTPAGIHLYNLVNVFTAGIPVLFVAGVECLLVGVVYGIDRVFEDLEYMTGYRVQNCLRKFLRVHVYIIPTFMFLLLGLDLYDRVKESAAEHLTGVKEYFPWWAFLFGWSLAIAPVMCVPIGMIIYVTKNPPWSSAVLYGMKHSPRFSHLANMHGSYVVHQAKKEKEKLDKERKKDSTSKSKQGNAKGKKDIS